MAPITLFKLLYFVQFCGYGILSPYMPVFYEGLKMRKSQIGVLTMLPNICSFLVAPVFGFVADKFDAHGEVLIWALLTSTGTTVTSLYMRNFDAQLPVVFLMSIFRAPIGPGIDALVMSALEDKAAYGAMRLWGAVSFGFCSLLGGYLTSTTTASGVSSFVILFYIYAITSMLSGYIIVCIVNESRWDEEVRTKQCKNGKLEFTNGVNDDALGDVTMTLERLSSASTTQSAEETELEVHSIYTMESPSSSSSTLTHETNDRKIVSKEQGKESTSRSDILGTLCGAFQRNPAVFVFAIVVFLSGFGAGAIDSYLFLRLKELGGSGLVMGIARFITCAAEVPMFQVAGNWQKKYGTWAMITLTQAAFVARFLYYAFLRNPWLVLPCEVLNGLTFAVTWSVSCTYANEIAPPGCQAVMQALLEGLHFGFGCGVGSLVGGFVYEGYGAVRLFQFCALLSGASTVLAAFAWRTQGAGVAADQKTISVNTDKGQEDSAHGPVHNSNRLIATVAHKNTVGKKGARYLELQQSDDNV